MAPSLLSACPSVFIPLTVIISLTSFTGLVGNTLAFYIFFFRYPASGFNTLLAALAAFDIFACLVHMPLDIATFSDMGTMRSYLCKATCFQLAFTASGSAQILLAIAIVRFNGIRNPVLGQFSTRSAHHIIVICVLMSAGIALPIIILFGSGPIEVSGNRTVEICMVEEKFMPTKGPVAYYFILASLYFVTFIAHSGLYAYAMYKLWHSKRQFVSLRGQKNVVMMSPSTSRANKTQPIPSPRVHALREEAANQSRGRTESGNSRGQLVPDLDSDTVSIDSSVTGSAPPAQAADTNNRNTVLSLALPTDSSVTESSDDIIELETETTGDQDTSLSTSPNSPTPRRPRPIPATRKNKIQKVRQPDASPKPSSAASYLNCCKRRDKKKGKEESKVQANNTQSIGNYRIMIVVIAISLTYFLSYAPHFGVMFYLFNHDASVFSKSSQELSFELLMRSFFLNNILDPVIYGLLSREFRRETIRLFRRIASFLCPCRS